ncbi:MAG: PD-(D/E)XK nuclease family protein [Planctomycetes bacterium]|nr:PD-(D/E)XK nuclease family protein [Planctomycetota bacterium]
MAEEELSSDEALKALERFVVENDDLLALEERIGRFNIFDALGIARRELQHSNFLAWLLDPAESHGQGALFLKAILMDLLAQTPPELRPLSPVELDGVELRGVDIRREWRKIDILITCEDPKFVIAIENKIASGEHRKQLSRYEKVVNEGFGNLPRQFVYLTIDGDEPSEEKWVPYTYGDIHRVLTRVRKTHATAIGQDVLAFLDHYLRLIRSQFMDDPQIDELCQRVYKNHRQALQLIYERVGSPMAGLVADIAETIGKDERWHLVNRTSKTVVFIPKAWLDVFPPIGARPTFDNRAWVVLRLDCGRKGCYFGVSVWPTTNRELRRAVIKELISDSDKFGCRVHGKLTDQWTRLHKSVVARWNEGDEPDFERVIAKVQKRLDEAERRLGGVPEALRPIFAEQATPAGSP